MNPHVRPRTAALFAGVLGTPEDAALAEAVGAVLGRAGFRLRHGGYNGLMEAAARGAASENGAAITAVTLAGKEEWGPFNWFVDHAVHAPTMGARLHAYLDDADLVVALGGGVGTLHELTAAVYYAGNIRPLPVRLVGPTTRRLHDFLVQDRWLVETPTRPLGFLRCLDDADALAADLSSPTAAGTSTAGAP